MVIICNGPYKTGSSLLASLLKRTLMSADIDDREELHPEKYILDMFARADSVQQVFKTHCYNERVLNMWNDNPKVLLVSTRRDLIDVLNSHYWHFVNEKFRIPKGLYLWTIGFLKLLEVEIYIKTETNFNIYTVDYEHLKCDPARVIKDVLEDLRLTPKVSIQSVVFDVLGNPTENTSNKRLNRVWFTKRKDVYFKKDYISVKIVLILIRLFSCNNAMVYIIKKVSFLDYHRKGTKFL